MNIAAAAPKGRPRCTAQLLQARQSQRLIHADLVAATDPKLRAILARAWCDLNEEIRKLRMKPLPKPVDVVPKRRKASDAAPIDD